MKILFLVQNYPPEMGAVRYTHDLAVGLARRGHSVFVVTQLPHYPHGRPLAGYSAVRPVQRVEDGVWVTRIPVVMGSNRQPLRRLAGFLTFTATGLVAALLQQRPDVIVGSIPPPTIASMALLLGRMRRTPVIHMIRDVEPHISLALRGLSARPWARWLTARANGLYRRAAHTVLVEPGQADLLRGVLHDDQVSIIPRGLDLEQFAKQSTAPVKHLGLRRPGRALALYCGTIGLVHDLPRLLRAFAAAAVRALPMDLVLMGDGESAPECQRYISESRLTNVRIVPPVEPTLAPAVLSSADLLVAAFRDGVQSVGLKVSEYCAAGKPVLIVGRCAAAELVRNVGNGWVCETPNGQNLLAVLRAYLNDPAQAQLMGQCGKAYACRHLSSTDQCIEWERLFSQLAGGLLP